MSAVRYNYFVPTCAHCDKPTPTAPCAHCGEENPIGTRLQSAAALARRRAADGSQICAQCSRCPEHCKCAYGGVHVPGNHGHCIECEPSKPLGIPPTPANGWTAATLRSALLYFPQDMPIRIFCPFDGEGPETWEELTMKSRERNAEVHPMTAPELAKLALAVLDAQKRYFKTRNREDMITSMKLEKELRTAAEGVLYGQA